MSLNKTWSLIVLLPLVPVVLLYLLFEMQLDRWEFESISKGNHTRTGSCSITKQRQQLVISGNFMDADKISDIWEGELIGLKGNNFLLVYSLQETGKENLYGLVQVPLVDASAREMSGIWSIVGRSDLEGRTYRRIKSK